jgi:hypothetical protein
MRPKEFDIDPANVDANGIADDLPTGTAWSFAADAEWLAISSGDNLAHQLIITTVADEPAGNAPVLTLTGTDADGNIQTEAITLPNTTTIESTKYWLTVSSGEASAATVGTFDIGWVDEVIHKTYQLDFRNTEAAAYAVNVTGTIDYTIQESFEDIQNTSSPSQNAAWHNLTALAAKTADLASIGTINATAVRLIINSYTDTAEIQLHISQG